MSMHYRPENEIVRSGKPRVLRRRKQKDGSIIESIITPVLEKIWSPMMDFEPRMRGPHRA